MAKVVAAAPICTHVLELISQVTQATTNSKWRQQLNQVNVKTPFIAASNGVLMALPNSYLRQRHSGTLEEFSMRRLAMNSIMAFANDLCYFINTFKEPSPQTIVNHAKNGNLLTRYIDFLESSDANLKSSTIKRRTLVAREFIAYVCNNTGSVDFDYDTKSYTKRSRIAETEVAITYFATSHTPGIRRRSPSTISILPPQILRRFLEGFLDTTHQDIAKLIYATGMRRSEVASLTASQIANIRPLFPGGPALITVIGKGNKERSIELEPQAIALVQRTLISKTRLTRLKRAGRNTYNNPNTTPLFINTFGKPISGEAIGDAFLRASNRSGIKRTPHELRHEFATQYILNAYKALEKKLAQTGLEAWLARLMIDQTSLIIEKLARLLGHSSSETTKRIYLVALCHAEPSIRNAWCEHLDRMESQTQ